MNQAYSRVTIAVQPSSYLDNVARSLTKIDEVSFLAITSGEHDIEINLVCKDNLERQPLLDVLQKKIHTIKGVYKTTSISKKNDDPN